MNDITFSCPIPIKDYPLVLLAHGGGGTLMHDLIENIFVAAFANDELNQRHDAAVLDCEMAQLAFTTDSYVVHPLIFPGGDIGSMSVYGTVNDLAMSGAVPKFIGAGFILEEGLEIETLWHIVQSMKKAADECGVKIVTGDTKVVDKGKGDGIFINTSGIGVLESKLRIHPDKVEEGDLIIVSGDIGRHGIAIMAQREGLEFQSEIKSDSAPVHKTVASLLKAGVKVHCLRDLTRGGLASALNEIASQSEKSIRIEESKIPVREDVHGACEILGFDPIYVACEGRFVAFVSKEDEQKAMDIMKNATTIGEVSAGNDGRVIMKSVIGVDRIVDMISGEQLPRIC